MAPADRQMPRHEPSNHHLDPQKGIGTQGQREASGTGRDVFFRFTRMMNVKTRGVRHGSCLTHAALVSSSNADRPRPTAQTIFTFSPVHPFAGPPQTSAVAEYRGEIRILRGGQRKQQRQKANPIRNHRENR